MATPSLFAIHMLSAGELLAALGVLGLVAWGMKRLGGMGRGEGSSRTLRSSPGGSSPARFASRGDLSSILVHSTERGRIMLGTLASRSVLLRSSRGLRSSRRFGSSRRPGSSRGLRFETPLIGGRFVAAEVGQSVLVVGPTQSGKTTGLAVPAILEWDGPVIAASVKSDLARMSAASRASKGEVLVFDPTGSTDLPSVSWSPLMVCRTWEGARRMANALSEVARSSSGGGLTDGEFWYATAAKLVAPLLHAAALGDLGMQDVLRWVDLQEMDEPARLLEDALRRGSPGARAALQAAEASFGREERQRSSVYTTAETMLESFGESGGPTGASAAAPHVDPERILSSSATLYLCAPAHDQRRVRPIFATLVGELIATAYRIANRSGMPLDPPLLVVLDEAANIAPLADLDVLASTAAGHGVQLVTIWQDVSQINARYGARAGSVVNNHRAKLFLAGICDPPTLEQVSLLAGEAGAYRQSVTRDPKGNSSLTEAEVRERLIAPDALRRLALGQALLLYGHLPPVALRLRRASIHEGG